MEDVKEVISGIDRRLGVHINIVSENLGKMAHMVEEVRDVLIDNPEPHSEKDGSDVGHDRPKQWSKFDMLLSSIHPLVVVRKTNQELFSGNQQIPTFYLPFFSNFCLKYYKVFQFKMNKTKGLECYKK